jgi:hypothetical protein
MKLGVSYNLFDGEELLEKSILSIRENVDYISVVFQMVSNLGDICNPEIKNQLIELKSKGLINDFYLYIPTLHNSPHYNEITKRNIGLELSKLNNCTHHISMDTDEFYLDKEFKFLKEEMITNDYDSSCCQMQTYYKEPIYQIFPPEEYYVSLIFKIREGIQFEYATSFPTLVDPTRRMFPDNCRIFSREEIQMHHFSYVRNDIRKKFNNSSSINDIKNNIDIVSSYWDNYIFPNKALWATASNKIIEFNINKVENIFKI